MAASATSMKTKKTFGQWFKSRKVQQWLVIVSFMIVPVLLLLVFSYVPFAKMFEFSLYKMKSYDSKNNTYPPISKKADGIPSAFYYILIVL